MTSDEFDVIVVGAGMAGLCCAGELVLQGARPLLIAETKEVGLALKPHTIGGNRFLMQIPTWQIAWGGGWWPHLARRLNLAVSVPEGFGVAGYDLAVRGSGSLIKVPQSMCSTSALTEVLCTAFPAMREVTGEFERLLDPLLNLPYQELCGLHDVSVSQWLEDEKADELVAHLMVTLSAAMTVTTGDFAREYNSVFGMFATLRSGFFGEANYGYIYPDAREGLAIPLSRAVEQRGGTVWRGRKMAQVLVDNERAVGVLMADGTEVRAPMVALGCGVDRLAHLLESPPPELEGPIRISKRNAHRDLHVFAVLDKPVVPGISRNWIGVLDPAGSLLQWMGPQHNQYPWASEPGKQMVSCATCMPEAEMAAQGLTPEDLKTRLLEVTEEIYPGFKDGVEVLETYEHKSGHLWFDNLTTGPKLPRRSRSIDGLWLVNEASFPTHGLYMDAAAASGITGARGMRDAANGRSTS